MNAKTTMSGIGSATVPGALIIGVALLAGSFAGLKAERNQYRAEAAQPRPTVTRTVTAAPQSVTITGTPSPSTSGDSPPTAGSVVPASRTQRHVSAPGKAPDAGSRTQASAPHPSPATNPPAAVQCSGQILAVRLLNAACVSLGGSK